MTDNRHVDILAIRSDLDHAGRIVAKAWPGVVGWDDISQDLAEKLLRLPKELAKLVVADDDQRIRWLAKIGHKIATTYRDDYERYSGKLMYSTIEVRAGLLGGALTMKSTVSTHLDIQASLFQLSLMNPVLGRVIRNEYQWSEPNSDRKQVSRAVDALTKLMNRAHKEKNPEHYAEVLPVIPQPRTSID
jgi:hypothetical protein